MAQIAERILAEAAGEPIEEDRAGGPGRTRTVPAMREALLRDRAELDDLRRRMLTEREQGEAARRDLANQQRRLNAERSKLARAAEVVRLRHIAAGLPRRLEQAGVSPTQLALAARRDISVVSRVLAGYAASAHVIEVAERLLARKQQRRAVRRTPVVR